MALLAKAPSGPVALIGFVLAVAALEIGAGRKASGAKRSFPANTGPSDGFLLPPGLAQACLTYVALRLAVDLVPQAGAIPDAVARSGSRYINYVRGAENLLSFTALGGAPIVMATLYLLWSYRAVGGLGRLLVAAGVPVVWFSLLAIVTPDVTAGPLAAFSRGSLHELFWLVLAAVVGVALSKGQAGPGSARPTRL